ncbi:hypothetical protein [Rubrobacter taiwanensis]|jgi:hypothetical protein|nr:hypothetical protein [Rubrobacter taiwanensis]
MEHRVLLVREWDQQMSGSGCCGRLGGVNHELGEESTYAHNRSEMERMGEVYRALKAELFDEDVEFAVVDPRNAIWLVPNILRDAVRRGLPAREILRSVRDGVSQGAIIVDGRVLFSGRIPKPEEAVAAVRSELGVA